MSLIYSLHTSAEKTMTIADTPTAAHMSNISGVQRSPWHSPVPYLFGGLAAMLGLIAFALLVLACSYWRLSGYLENERDVEAGGESNGGDGAEADDVKKTAPSTAPVLYEEKFLVINPGQQKPTCLATPMWSRASSFGSTSKSSYSSTSSSSSNTEASSSFGENKDKMQLESSGVVHHLEMPGRLTTNPTPHHLQQAAVSSGYIAQS